MSPIDDPDSPKARRLTRLAARMKTENKEPGATAPRRAGRVEPVVEILQIAGDTERHLDEGRLGRKFDGLIAGSDGNWSRLFSQYM